jgi:oligopeptide transport system substrate-binding protein
MVSFFKSSRISLSHSVITLNILLLLYSCSNKDLAGKSTAVFRMNISNGYLESMDPAYAKSLDMMRIDHMIYNTLVETDENLHLVPVISKSWDVSKDDLVYTFHLRDNIYFHDNPVFLNGKGRKLKASDVVYSFNRIIDPAVASYGAWIFNGRVAAHEPFVAINDSTVQIKLQKPFRPLPEILTMPYCSIVPHEAVEHWGKDFRAHPCGTGPFIFHYWDEGNALVLHRNSKYWEKDNRGYALPYLDAVQISFIDSKATEFLLFLQKKLHFVNGIDGSFKDLVLHKEGTLKSEYRSKFKLRKQTYLNTEYLGILMDTTQPVLNNSPLKNKLVRQAINYAIDRKKIATYFRNGIGTPATSGFIPLGMPGYDSTGRYGYNYNIQKALGLLAKAGYPNGKGLRPFTILTPDIWADIVNFVAGELQDIGIPVKVETIQANVLKQQMSRSGAACFRAQWLADYPDAESYMAFFNSELPAPPNYTRFSNSTFDRWYNESLNAPDTLRWSLYQKMDSLAMSEAPIIPLFYDQILHFIQNDVTGFSSNPMNIIELKRVKLTGK